MATLRVAAALGRALARKCVRETLDGRADTELVAVSPIVGTVRSRVEGGGVDLCLIDAGLDDVESLLSAARRRNVQVAVLVREGDGAAAARAFALPRGQVREISRDTGVRDVLAGLLPEQDGPQAFRRPGPAWSSTRPDVIVIGSSTGGPGALAAVLGDLPPWFDVPILIVQHMPPRFTALMARNLSRVTHLDVGEAGHGTTFGPGQVWIAPGGSHMVVDGPGRLAVNQDPPEQSCRPSVDVLFRSAAEVYGRRAIGVVLTGMGCDGARGSEALHRAGGSVVVQDAASSVVWGMPGAVVAKGVADDVVPLHGIVDAVVTRTGGRRRVPVGALAG
jgi:chemotaxis response regulator CheB